MKKKLTLFSIALVSILILAGCTHDNKDNNSSNDNNSEVTTTATPSEDKKDATNSNPGNSINPPDKGKTVQTDQFKYTLLDVREDTVDAVYGSGKVYLIKLEVERIGLGDSSNPDDFTGLSIAEVALSTDPTLKDTNKSFSYDFYYSRSKMGVDLGGDVSELKMNEKVVGYYVYSASKPESQPEIYFVMKNFSADSVMDGTFGKIMGTFKIK